MEVEKNGVPSKCFMIVGSGWMRLNIQRHRVEIVAILHITHRQRIQVGHGHGVEALHDEQRSGGDKKEKRGGGEPQRSRVAALVDSRRELKVLEICAIPAIRCSRPNASRLSFGIRQLEYQTNGGWRNKKTRWLLERERKRERERESRDGLEKWRGGRIWGAGDAERKRGRKRDRLVKRFSTPRSPPDLSSHHRSIQREGEE